MAQRWRPFGLSVLTLSLYGGSRYVRITNPHTLAMPPSALYARFKSVVKIHPESGHQRMALALIKRHFDDLALCGDDYITKESYFILREARRDYTFCHFWWCNYFTVDAPGLPTDGDPLNPQYFRRLVENAGYMPAVRWRHVSRARIEYFGLEPTIKKLARSNGLAHKRKRLRDAGILKTRKIELLTLLKEYQ